MDHSEHGENKHKIFKYTDKDGHVHYVDENGNLCGDVKFDEVEGIVGAITPVPGGVGTCLLYTSRCV